MSPPPLSETPVFLSSYVQGSIKGQALSQEIKYLLEKEAIELAPDHRGFYSRMFLVQKASGSWRSIIDLSTLNHFVAKTKFHMETVQSVLSSVRQGDWMYSIDLQDAYLQISVHQESRKFLRFMAGGKVYHFRALCFGLSTAPQVYIYTSTSTRIRMLRYLDDWLVQASSREKCIRARDTILNLCITLGIRVSFCQVLSDPIPDCRLFRSENGFHFFNGFTSQEAEGFRDLNHRRVPSCEDPPASLWRTLLEHLSSLTRLVPGGCLRMRSPQLQLRSLWDFQEESARIPWNLQIRLDLLWCPC